MFRYITNYEGVEVDHEMETVLMLGMMKMLVESLPLRRGEVGGKDGGDFPEVEASEK
jgi:hypothetical protein